eukprot:CAMPEP_0178914064 /NCGR_PEP_ID=MMETSP0786-20121207/11201_1 /TAXON_ID=186022 /ORGANISM="Thalassionema frauenfeldii, Strain CCMP 1798" /LENGTH=80 /DNA_ID=CAMNT_0020586897 /DNA_START=82 /DNA_END=322 /DNA_ORIENTATION=-
MKTERGSLSNKYWNNFLRRHKHKLESEKDVNNLQQEKNGAAITTVSEEEVEVLKDSEEAEVVDNENDTFEMDSGEVVVRS